MSLFSFFVSSVMPAILGCWTHTLIHKTTLHGGSWNGTHTHSSSDRWCLSAGSRPAKSWWQWPTFPCFRHRSGRLSRGALQRSWRQQYVSALCPGLGMNILIHLRGKAFPVSCDILVQKLLYNDLHFLTEENQTVFHNVYYCYCYCSQRNYSSWPCIKIISLSRLTYRQ
jgi:hypothetical protein